MMANNFTSTISPTFSLAFTIGVDHIRSGIGPSGMPSQSLPPPWSPPPSAGVGTYVEVTQFASSCSTEGDSSKLDVDSFHDFPVCVPRFIINPFYSSNHWFTDYHMFCLHLMFTDHIHHTCTRIPHHISLLDPEGPSGIRLQS